MIFSSEATTLQSLVPLLLERTFQASWEMHLLSNIAYGLPIRDITRRVLSEYSNIQLSLTY
jgi:hypothetical protein